MIGGMIGRFESGEGLSRGRVALTAGGILWLCVCAAELLHAIDYPTKIGICAAIMCAALPIAFVRAARLPIYLLCAYAVLVPFSSILVTQGGETLTKVLGIIAGGSLVASMGLRRRVAYPSRALFLVLLLSAYAGLTICWAIDPLLAASTYGTFLSYAGLYAAIALYASTPSEMRLVIMSTVVGAVALAAYGGYLFSHGQQVYESRLGIGFADANWIDSNEYAAALLTPLSIILMMFLRSRLLYKKLAWSVVLAVTMYGFVISGSRGGMFALGAILLLFGIRSRYRSQLLALAPLLLIVIFASPIGHRLLQADVVSADLRTDIWKIGIASLQRYWLAGAGIGNFGHAYAQFFLATPHATLSWDRVAHSILIQGAVEYGVPGLLLLVAVWYAQFMELANLKLDSATRDLSLALQAGIIGLFVAGLSLSLMLAKYTWLSFALIALVRSSALCQGSPAARLRDENSRAASRLIGDAIEA